MNKNSNFFDEQGHLNDAGIMLWADAMRLQRELELPEALQEHLELCSQCRMSVFDYYEFKKEDDIAELANHFYFDNKEVSEQPIKQTPVKPITTVKAKGRTGIIQRQIAVAASVVVLLVAGFWVAQNINKKPATNPGIANQNVSDTNRNTPSVKDKSVKTHPNKLAEKNIDSAKQKSNEPPKVKEVVQNPPAPVFDDAIAFLDQKIQRNTHNRGNQKASQPQQGATFKAGESIGFSWDSSQAAEAFELRLFTKNTQGMPQIIKIDGATSQYQFTGQLKSGKHYWRLFKVNQGRKKEISLGSFQVK
ncbi:hypothetical protein [Microscilla marina]|uniref:Uncharacterized protein n=1 Tax=Microscilla marina ATCC 23134 TaxID=313606 RepID=A1ZQG3_MICM2|nr:hypothetical protein [Microscilla marina]EAY27335.1 hypothetical protein M23134_08287 [Microscilla marina ATCC 23134]